MKWTQEYVWDKIESIIPYARKCEYVLPQALKDAAVKLFLLSETEDSGSYRAYVIKVCLEELNEKGWLDCGEIDEDWK